MDQKLQKTTSISHIKRLNKKGELKIYAVKNYRYVRHTKKEILERTNIKNSIISKISDFSKTFDIDKLKIVDEYLQNL